MEKIYSIKIEKPDKRREFCVIHLNKSYGDSHGGCIGANSREEAIQRIRDWVKDWESFDSIVQRMGNKVTRKNTEFSSFDESIILTDVLNNGQKKLF